MAALLAVEVQGRQGVVLGQELGAAGSSVNSMQPRQHWDLWEPVVLRGHEELEVDPTGDTCCPILEEDIDEVVEEEGGLGVEVLQEAHSDRALG